MTKFRAANLRHRCVALVTAVVTVAGVMLGMSAAPASAAPASAAATEKVCLTNADSYCLGIGPFEAGVIGGIIAEVIREIAAIIIVIVSKDDENDDEEELVDANNTGLCLADTGLSNGVGATWQPCGANGTVWIWVPHSDGHYLDSRFALDNGFEVLALTVDPLSNGSRLFVTTPSQPGGADWQTFSDY